MQKIAAYLLERRDLTGSTDARNQQIIKLKDEVWNWLTSKGGSRADLGVYSPEDGSSGRFETMEASDGGDSWWMLQLQEDTIQGRQTRVSISVTSADSKVAVYLTMEVGWSQSLVQPIDFDPRCPRLVKNILRLPGSFYHGATQLRVKTTYSGFDGGQNLVAEIMDSTRTVPFVVVSQEYGNVIIPRLDESIEHSLAGLANIVVVDEDAAWAITDTLGKRLSCYMGAVRLYWPRLSLTDDPYGHPLWTADRIRTSSESLGSSEPILRKLRSLVFGASALSVIRPAAIDRIRNAQIHRTHDVLRKNAKTAEEFERLADDYAEDNDNLRLQQSQLQAENDDLRTRLAKADVECAALKAHLNAKEARDRSVITDAGLEPDAPGEDGATQSPQDGEVRYYKKVYSTPSHDVFEMVNDCGCNRWQNAHSADKARKGLLKLEGRSDFKSMQHCGSCTGGGVWKVRW